MADSPITFFRTMEAGFTRMLRPDAGPTATIEALTSQAFDWFEMNAAIQTEGHPPLACDKGCPTCCSLRVTATAPEIFLLARYVQMVDASSYGASLELSRRVQEANEATQSLDEKERFSLARACPLIVEGVCIVHPVRTLACRGHAAFDVEGCRAAAAGKDVEVAISEPHLMLRGLVQNALQSALRDAGLAWGLYELNHGLALALEDPTREAAWHAGEDSLAPTIAELDMDVLGAAFDQIHAIN